MTNNCLYSADIIELLTSPPKAPLTLEEVKKMEGEPVWLHTFSSSKKKPHFSMGNPGTCFRSQRNVYSSWLQQSFKKAAQ